MDEAEYCDRVTIMNEGRIVALDTPSALRGKYSSSSIEELFVKIARPKTETA
jgi:ABC-2 type transport system ATP-binding protein